MAPLVLINERALLCFRRVTSPPVPRSATLSAASEASDLYSVAPPDLMRIRVEVSVLEPARATDAKARNRNAMVFFINPFLKKQAGGKPSPMGRNIPPRPGLHKGRYRPNAGFPRKRE